jgi:hypothetical protein
MGFQLGELLGDGWRKIGIEALRQHDLSGHGLEIRTGRHGIIHELV